MKYKHSEDSHSFILHENLKYICLHYEQFEKDADTMTEHRHDDFGLNPKERFPNKVRTVLDEVIAHERFLPSRFAIRLENKHSICNCRVDYVFEIMRKDYLKGNLRAKEISEELLEMCMETTGELVLIYIGMNR